MRKRMHQSRKNGKRVCDINGVVRVSTEKLTLAERFVADEGEAI